jgi:glycerate dehydrogenase
VRGVFLDLDTLNPQDLDLVPLRLCLPHWQFFPSTAPGQVSQRIKDAQVVVTNKVVLDASHLRAAPGLRLICVAATGADNIDLAAAAAAGVVVSNARDYATASVVEHVFMLILTLLRHTLRYRDRVRSGDWSHSPGFCLFDETIEELSGRTIGIIGYGVLGQAVARLADAFSMQVKIAQRLRGDPLPDRLPLARLLSQSDVVTLHCPLTEQTRGLIGETELQTMKSSAILINAARGGIVDEAALVRALQQGWIAGAGIDVLSSEPPDPDNPLLQFASPRLLVTPHIAWASKASRHRLVAEIIHNIEAYIAGQPRNRLC